MGETTVRASGLGTRFALFWAGESVSVLGSMVNTVALPLVAIAWLPGSVLDVGLIGTLQFLPSAVGSLLAGAVVDRIRRKKALLTAANLTQCLAIGSIPAAGLVGYLTFAQLYVVAFVCGCASVFFDLSYGAFLRSIVQPSELSRANSRLQLSASVARVGGPGVGGALVSAIGAPLALAVDAASFAFSAGMIAAICDDPPATTNPGRSRKGYLSSIMEGLRFTYADPALRMLATSVAMVNVGLTAIGVIEIPYLITDLGLGPTVVGVVMAIGAIGSALGAAATTWSIRILGDARVLVVAFTAIALASFLLPASSGAVGAVLFVAGLFVLELAITVSTVIALTFNQTYCPPTMIARVAASMRTLQMGLVPVGSLLGGVLGTALGNQGALWICAAINVVPVLTMLMSPPGRRRDLPKPADTAG